MVFTWTVHREKKKQPLVCNPKQCNARQGNNNFNIFSIWRDCSLLLVQRLKILGFLLLPCKNIALFHCCLIVCLTGQAIKLKSLHFFACHKPKKNCPALLRNNFIGRLWHNFSFGVLQTQATYCVSSDILLLWMFLFPNGPWPIDFIC